MSLNWLADVVSTRSVWRKGIRNATLWVWTAKVPVCGRAASIPLIGMNSRTMGDYAPEDVEFSRSYPTRLARAKAELQEMGRRVKAMGVSGFFRHLCEKNILTYGDGTFSWGKEGKFFHTLFQEKGRPFASFLRKVYYTREYGGVYYPFFCIMSLIFWLGILFWSVVGGLIGREPLTNALCLTLLLLAVFEMLFECRARYLFGFTPLYLIFLL